MITVGAMAAETVRTVRMSRVAQHYPRRYAQSNSVPMAVASVIRSCVTAETTVAMDTMSWIVLAVRMNSPVGMVLAYPTAKCAIGAVTVRMDLMNETVLVHDTSSVAVLANVSIIHVDVITASIVPMDQMKEIAARLRVDPTNGNAAMASASHSCKSAIVSTIVQIVAMKRTAMYHRHSINQD